MEKIIYIRQFKYSYIESNMVNGYIYVIVEQVENLYLLVILTNQMVLQIVIVLIVNILM